MVRLAGPVLVALLLAGCPTPETLPSDAQPTPGPDLALPSGAAGGTPWRDTGLPVEFDAEARHPSPDHVVQAVAAALADETLADGPAPQITADVLEESEQWGTGRVVVGGFADDSVYGGDYFLALERDEAGWHVAQTWTRDLCRRGVSNGLCL